MGIAFFVYVPIMYILGKLMQRILMNKQFLECENSQFKQLFDDNINKLSQSQKAVVGYILQVNQQMSHDDIVVNLSQAGWSSNEINEAFAIVK